MRKGVRRGMAHARQRAKRGTNENPSFGMTAAKKFRGFERTGRPTASETDPVKARKRRIDQAETPGRSLAAPLPKTCSNHLLGTKWPRRFCCQQASVDSMQKGFSLPQLVEVRRSAGTPRLTRYCLTALARRSPRARLYSVEPRSSQWPSMVTRAWG